MWKRQIIVVRIRAIDTQQNAHYDEFLIFYETMLLTLATFNISFAQRGHLIQTEFHLLFLIRIGTLDCLEHVDYDTHFKNLTADSKVPQPHFVHYSLSYQVQCLFGRTEPARFSI